MGGAGLARGYLRRPELTAERFVPHPFAKEKGTRLYRSGDLVRWREDGELEFVGRIDEQVKVRGYRVELGEIEAVLRQHASVNDALVMVHEHHDEKELVAYVVPRPDHTSTNNDEGEPVEALLREFVDQQLPAYMVPVRYVLLQKFPLNAHGKVERKALPAPEYGRAETGVEYVAPRTPLEETVASIWAEVLRLDRVGVKDSFFALGGHSLLAMQVTSRIRETLEPEIPLRALFEHRTVESYALALLQNRIEEDDQADLSELLSELDGLSDEHVRVLLAHKP
jgi:hypothetical protein